METNFSNYGLAPFLEEALKSQNITTPTEIQHQVITEVMDGQNVIAKSQTGTGKTLAFALPMLSKINEASKEMQVLILAPTHELAMQIHQVIKELTKDTALIVDAFIGSANINRQMEKLKKQKPQIAVGTPGRVLELVEKKKLKLHQVKFVAVDEADRLAQEKPHWDTVVQLLKRISNESQYIFVSATMADDVQKKISDEVPTPVYLSAGEGMVITKDVQHTYVVCEERDKIDLARKFIINIPIKKGIVFVNHLDKVNETADKLKYKGITVQALASDRNKEERAKALKAFHDGEIHVLVASDVAARGLDVNDVTHIINLQLPVDDQAYVHRAGRTGRMGKSGVVLSLVEKRQMFIIEKFEKALGIKLEELIYKQGKLHAKA